jgi:hydroxymethylpyrimidine/phosphomethylpyrimidine kinase
MGCNFCCSQTLLLLNREIMAAVASQVEALEIGNLVVDPVMVSRSGDRFLFGNFNRR